MNESEDAGEIPIKGRGQSQIHDGSREPRGANSYESIDFGMVGGPSMCRLKCKIIIKIIET